MLAVRVAAVEPVAQDVRALTLAPEPGGRLPAFSPGSHIVVHVPVAGGSRRNPYSLACAPWATGSYRIVVRRIPDGRGSTGIHDRLGVGDRLLVEPPQNFFPPDLTARRHVLVAGGIGVTPFVSYIHALQRAGTPFELHYAFRDAASAPLLHELHELCGDALHPWADADGSTLMTQLRGQVLGRQPIGTHLSVCGPAPMIDAVIGAAHGAGWPATRVHTERFEAAGGPMEAFGVRLARSGRALTVPEGVTLLDALERAGVRVPSRCRLGFCGECRTGLLDGEADHRDAYLDPDERAGAVMPCVSRAREGALVLDL